MKALLRVLMAMVVLVGRIEAWLLPVSWLFAMGRLSARAMVRFMPGLRATLLDNARHLLGPDSTLAERRALAVAVLTSFSRFFVEILTAPKTYPDPEAFFARAVGRAHGEAAYAQGKGVIGLTLHMGNAELGSMLLTRLFQPVAVVYHRDPFGLVESMRSRKRRAHALEEIHTDGAPFFGVRVLDVLRRRGFVLAAGDLGFAHERGETYPFLDGQARFLTWPARLALTSGAPIVPSFVVREADGQYAVRMEPAIDPAEAGDVDTIMLRLIAIYERYVRAYPDQWLILHRYWEPAPEATP